MPKHGHHDYLNFLRVSGWRSEYKSVNALLKHLARKSRSLASRKAYLQRLFCFCVYVGTDPDELIKQPQNLVEELLQTYTDRYNNGRYSVRYLNNIQALLKTFFEVNGFKGSKRLDVEGYYMPARYRKAPEYIPTKHEVYLMADSAVSLRDRAIILTLFSSGLRNSTLRALLYKDVKDELLKNYYNVLIPVYPEMKLVDPYACKNNISYYSFTYDEATEAIKLYLHEREDRYGEIGDGEPLFISEYNQISKSERRCKILTSRMLQNIVKYSAKRAGISQWRHVSPHCLRKSFESVLHSELIGGGHLDPKVQEFFMGHILPGSQDVYFDSSKVEQLRMEYSKLNFGRRIIENKFKTLRMAVSRAFEGTGIDIDEILEQYVAFRRAQKSVLKLEG